MSVRQLSGRERKLLLILVLILLMLGYYHGLWMPLSERITNLQNYNASFSPEFADFTVHKEEHIQEREYYPLETPEDILALLYNLAVAGQVEIKSMQFGSLNEQVVMAGGLYSVPVTAVLIGDFNRLCTFIADLEKGDEAWRLEKLVLSNQSNVDKVWQLYLQLDFTVKTD